MSTSNASASFWSWNFTATCMDSRPASSTALRTSSGRRSNLALEMMNRLGSWWAAVTE
ncbi:Uncharacterised protein [Bordetella pertussis]|nr:Uncharacterised protein [Bordetella pertussis]